MLCVNNVPLFINFYKLFILLKSTGRYIIALNLIVLEIDTLLVINATICLSLIRESMYNT